MEISKISNFYLPKAYAPKTVTNPNQPRISLKSMSQQDTFVKSANVNFTGNVAKVEKRFEEVFNHNFFLKLLREKVPDAYTGRGLVSIKDIISIKYNGDMYKRGPVAIGVLKQYRGCMFPTEKNILTILENQSKKHPNLKLQDLLKRLYPKAEKTLIKQQSSILNKINLMIRELPQEEFEAARKVIQESFDKIFAQNPPPEKRFSRKTFINKLGNVEIKDKRRKAKIMAEAEKLPQSANSVEAFIVKYSQPYKLRYDYKNKEYVKITRDSEEVGLRLLEPSVGTDEHIHPQCAYRKEKLARENGDEAAQDLSSFRVTILTSKKINEIKTDTPLDDFIVQQKANDIDIPENIQKHIKRLIEIDNKWFKCGKYQDASLLADYIKVLKDEFDLRSNIVKVELGDFEEKIPQIKAKATQQREKLDAKRAKRAARETADFINGVQDIQLENRKTQKHSARFNH